MTTTTTEALVRDIKAAIAELADGRTFPDLLAAIDTLAERSKPQDAQIVQPPLLGWTFNHTQQQTDEDGPVPGTWEIGWLDDEDDTFSPVLVLDTWLYNQEDMAEPLARAILARLAP